MKHERKVEDSPRKHAVLEGEADLGEAGQHGVALTVAHVRLDAADQDRADSALSFPIPAGKCVFLSPLLDLKRFCQKHQVCLPTFKIE